MLSPMAPPRALPASSSALVSTMPMLYSLVPLHLISSNSKFQRIQNTLTRIVTRQHGWTRTTQSLATLHCLPVKLRVDFKVATTFYKLLSTGQPSYLTNSVCSWSLTEVNRRGYIVSPLQKKQSSVRALSDQPLHPSGIDYRLTISP